MQTREQVKNWKVVASVATVAALGISGLAVAGTGDDASTPPAIEISDQRSLREVTTTTTPFEVVPAPSFTADDSFESPLASDSLDSVGQTGRTAPADTGQNDSPAIDDSPDDSPAPAPAPAPADDSVDSANSGDSLDT